MCFCLLLEQIKHDFLDLVLSRVQLFVAPWTVAPQAPLAMGFSRQEYWSGVPFPTSGNLLTKGSNQHVQCLLCWQADFFFFFLFTTSTTWEAQIPNLGICQRD